MKRLPRTILRGVLVGVIALAGALTVSEPQARADGSDGYHRRGVGRIHNRSRPLRHGYSRLYRGRSMSRTIRSSGGYGGFYGGYGGGNYRGSHVRAYQPVEKARPAPRWSFRADSSLSDLGDNPYRLRSGASIRRENPARCIRSTFSTGCYGYPRAYSYYRGFHGFPRSYYRGSYASPRYYAHSRYRSSSPRAYVLHADRGNGRYGSVHPIRRGAEYEAWGYSRAYGIPSPCEEPLVLESSEHYETDEVNRQPVRLRGETSPFARPIGKPSPSRLLHRKGKLRYVRREAPAKP